MVLDGAGATRSSFYGRLADRDLYRAILRGERDLFVNLANELADSLLSADITYVVGDAVEGFNPGHDVCRLLLNAALLRIERMGGRPIRNMEFPVEGPPNECPAEDRAEAFFFTLDDEAYQRKLQAARTYPELAAEMERVLSIHSADMFRFECIRPVRYGLDIGRQFSHPCFYERYGEKQVAAGIYREVIRFHEHVAPLAAHLEFVFGARRSLPA